MRHSGLVPVPAPTNWMLTLPWPRPPLPLAIPLRGVALASLQRRARRSVHLMAAHVQLPRGLARVRIELHWESMTSTESVDLTETLKLAVDALVAYGLVPHDDSRHVSADWHVHRGSRNICWLEINDLQPVR